MKQTIRFWTFETNSSSYHTLSINKRSNKPKKREIIKGEDLIINNHIDYKTIGCTESYSFIGTSSYEKAQMVLRFMGFELENYFDELEELEPLYRDEDGCRDWDKYEKVFKEHFYEMPLIKAFVNAIKRYIGEDKNVTIEFNNSDDPYIETVDDECTSPSELFSVDDLTDVEVLTDVFYDIIFNDDIEMTEECDSNE